MLKTASDSLFPAAQRAQQAEAGFEASVKAFSDAFILQDATAVQRAAENGRGVVSNLNSAADIKGLPKEKAEAARKLASSVAQFVEDAQSVYGAALANAANMNGDTQARIRQLAERTKTIQTSLQSAKEDLSANLREELAKGAQRSVEQRWLSLILLLATLIVAGTVVNITIRRSITNLLKAAVTNLTATASSTETAAKEIAEASQALAQASSEQAASLEEISASSEEINSISNQNADHSRAAAQKMAVAAGHVSDANGRLTDMMASMNDIDASSGKVSKIIRTIDEIAFQTNILALNAAVEAARAGEAGMGFAVVADEVRNLAQRCAEAARNTAKLIEESIETTKTGKTRLDQVAEIIQLVTASATEVKTAVDEIQMASMEQARGIQQVTSSLTQMRSVTDRNAAGAEESASAAEELSTQSRSMNSVIESLAGIVYGQQ